MPHHTHDVRLLIPLPSLRGMIGIYLWEILPRKFGLGSEDKTKVDSNQLLQGCYFVLTLLPCAVIVE